MRKILYAMLASLALYVTPANAQQTNGQLLSLINQNLPTNDQELITAAMVRTVLDQMVLSTNVFGQQSCASGALSPYQPFTNNTTPSSVALTIFDGNSCVQWATLNQTTHTITIAGTTSFANPTAVIGLNAINGTAITAMRSDAAPAISQSIIPTWTGLHTFNGGALVPTRSPGDNTTNAASTAFVQTAVNPIAALPTATGTCPIDTQVGNNIRGTFQLNGACAGGTVILTLATTAAAGWFCSMNDRTNVANTFVQTGSSTTSATFTGTGADNDIIGFECAAY